jgi:maltose alpha-D-glucosyltransferase/alpha-amylase
MQWSADRNAGFSRSSAQRLYLPVNIDPDYHYETVNVEARQNNPSSSLWYMKRLISLRKRFRAFGRGAIEFLYPENAKVLAFVRSYEEEKVLVVANLSRFSQFVELDLSAFVRRVPVELFGQTEFPVIKDQPYLLTLGPHAFYWFALEQQQVSLGDADFGHEERRIPALLVAGNWDHLFRKEDKGRLERILPGYLKTRRWFGGKARRIKSSVVRDVVPLPGVSPPAVILLVQVEYGEGDPETYTVPLAFSSGERSAQVKKEFAHAIVAFLTVSRTNGDVEGVIYDAFFEGLSGASGGRRRSTCPLPSSRRNRATPPFSTATG